MDARILEPQAQLLVFRVDRHACLRDQHVDVAAGRGDAVHMVEHDRQPSAEQRRGDDRELRAGRGVAVAAGAAHDAPVGVGVDVDVEIRDEDIKMDVYRASGAGGQKVNKTSSAVRLTHIPTGIVVSCQIERSQHQNREVAMRMLKSKLVEIKERENLERIEDIKGDQKEIAWGSQIRSYVFMPYTMVKDHRTNFEMGNITAVMDGDLDGFINAYLKMKSVEGVE